MTERKPHCARTPSKIKYMDEEGAQAAIRRYTENKAARGQPFAARPYPCDQCGWWHLTSDLRGSGNDEQQRSAPRTRQSVEERQS